MSVLLVTYDLHKPDHHYSDLWDALKKYTHIHPLNSVWLLDTIGDPTAVRTKLKESLLYKEKDQLFVVRLHQDWASLNMHQAATWLKDTSRTWD
jgi:hypothetical protein